MGGSLWSATYGVQPMGMAVQERCFNDRGAPMGCNLWGEVFFEMRVQSLGRKLWGATSVALCLGQNLWQTTFDGQPSMEQPMGVTSKQHTLGPPVQWNDT